MKAILLFLVLFGSNAFALSDSVIGAQNTRTQTSKNFVLNPSAHLTTQNIVAVGSGVTIGRNSSPTSYDSAYATCAMGTNVGAGCEFKTDYKGELNGKTCAASGDYTFIQASGGSAQAQLYNGTTVVGTFNLIAGSAGTLNPFSIIYPCGSLSTMSVRFVNTVAGASSPTVRARLVKFGEAIIQTVPINADFQPLTGLSGSWTTNTTYSGKYARQGSLGYFDITVSLTGAPNATGLVINLPFTIDSTQLNTSDGATPLLASAGKAFISSSDHYDIFAAYNSPTSVAIRALKWTNNNFITISSAVANNLPATFGSSDYVTVKFAVPIVEFKANFPAITSTQQMDRTAEVMFYDAVDCPSGSIPAIGKSVGKSSGDYQGPTYLNLYRKWWAMPGLTTTAGNEYVISAAKGSDADSDWNAGKTITVDKRGLFPRIAGGNSSAIGATQGDAIRNITGTINNMTYVVGFSANGVFGVTTNSGSWAGSGAGNYGPMTFDASRVVPTAPENRPVNGASIACINPQWFAPSPVIFGIAPTITTLTASSGTYTPPAGTKYLKIKMIGGGGGGAGANFLSQSGFNGVDGGSSTFGSSLLIASGGGGGRNNAIGACVPFSGTINAPAFGVVHLGTYGGSSSMSRAAQDLAGPNGGSTYFGTGGPGGYAQGGTAGSAPASTGGGGGGGGIVNAANAYTGGGGCSGGYLEATIPNPVSTYSYTIGSGGNGGAPGASAGSSLFAGGNGGSGVIIIEEFYQ